MMTTQVEHPEFARGRVNIKGESQHQGGESGGRVDSGARLQSGEGTRHLRHDAGHVGRRATRWVGEGKGVAGDYVQTQSTH